LAERPCRSMSGCKDSEKCRKGESLEHLSTGVVFFLLSLVYRMTVEAYLTTSSSSSTGKSS